MNTLRSGRNTSVPCWLQVGAVGATRSARPAWEQLSYSAAVSRIVGQIGTALGRTERRLGVGSLKRPDALEWLFCLPTPRTPPSNPLLHGALRTSAERRGYGSLMGFWFRRNDVRRNSRVLLDLALGDTIATVHSAGPD